MNKTIKTRAGNLHLYDNYIIAEVNEGETVTTLYADIITDLGNTHYKSKPFIYISNRINSYAVDPIVYKKTSEIESLIGFAIVSKKRIALRNTEIESLFSSKPLKLFTNLEDAITWIKSIIN